MRTFVSAIKTVVVFIALQVAGHFAETTVEISEEAVAL